MKAKAKTKALPRPEIGDMWRDCDKRMSRRAPGLVVAVDDERATLQFPSGDKATILIRRMRPNSTGWALVSRATVTENEPLETQA